MSSEEKTKKVLIVFARSEVGVCSVIEAIKKKNPTTTADLLIPEHKRFLFEKNESFNEIITYGGRQNLGWILRLLKKLKAEKYDKAIIPTNETQASGLKDINYTAVTVILKAAGIDNIEYISKDGKPIGFSLMQLISSASAEILKTLLSPPITFILTPLFLLNEFIKNFLLTKTKKDDELMGFGGGIGFTGLIYVLTKSKMAKRYGLFGIAHNDYMGYPVTLQRGFFDLWIFNISGFRKTVLLSIILSALALLWLNPGIDTLLFAAIIVVAFLSPYFIEEIYLGVLEVFSWPLFMLTFAAYYSGNIMLASIFFALLIFSHAGIGLLCCLSISTYVAVNLLYGLPPTGALLDYIVFGLLTTIITTPHLLPFIRSRSKFSRNELINKAYAGSYWSKRPILQAATYSIFIASAFIYTPITPLHYVLLLPLLALVFNTTIKWLFSAYTVDMFIWTTGIIFMLLNPRIETIIPYVYVIYTSPSILVNRMHGSSRYGFSLKPVTLGEKRKELLALFSKVEHGNRIALEGGTLKKQYAYHYNPLMSYLLVDEDVELLNGHGPEFVEPSIYWDIVQYLDSSSPKEKIEEALNRGGASYIVAYDEKFKENLLAFGFNEIGSVDCKKISLRGDAPGPVVTLFKAPFEAATIEPKTKLSIVPNEIRFTAKKDSTYILKYSYLLGWKAFQDKKELLIGDAHPGMIIRAPEDGEIVLQYRYRYYWVP